MSDNLSQIAQKINFNDTKIAFESKTDGQLTKARYLFKVMSSSGLVKIGNALTKIAIGIHFPVGWAARPTLYAHFVGGESIEKCNKTVKTLGEYNVKAILDYSVEGTDNDKAIEEALQETIRSIKNAGQNPNIPFAVFKPTAFGNSAALEKASEGMELNDDDKKELQKFKNRINTLCKTAFEADIPILVDAEDTWFQNIFDVVVTEMMEKYNKTKAIVFNTYQMYRWDRLDILKQAHKAATESGYYLGAKFVRGAYMEKERARAEEKGYKDPIQPDKESTDRDYNLALKYCIENLENITLFNGTHNEYSSQYMADLMEENNIAKDDPRCWFSQLYGMSDHISFNLAKAGYNVAKYLPYGPVRHVLPYLLRRAEENTSAKGQSGRELQLIETEVKRRKDHQKE